MSSLQESSLEPCSTLLDLLSNLRPTDFFWSYDYLPHRIVNTSRVFECWYLGQCQAPSRQATDVCWTEQLFASQIPLQRQRPQASFCLRAFALADPSIWNALPPDTDIPHSLIPSGLCSSIIFSVRPCLATSLKLQPIPDLHQHPCIAVSHTAVFTYLYLSPLGPEILFIFYFLFIAIPWRLKLNAWHAVSAQ